MPGSTPSSSGEMFFSSPPRDCRAGPADEVLLLVARAQVVKVLSPAVAAFLCRPEQHKLFKNVFIRQIHLLKSRSQAFEDGHVTVYDKTLLTLTRNGNDLEAPAAIEYFCEEFLGINKLGDPATIQKTLQQSVTLPALLTREYSPPDENAVEFEQRSDQVCTAPPAITPSSAARSVCHTTQSKEMSLNKQSPEMEPKLARLWTVYEKARADFLAVQGKSDNVKTASAAKFLRDTAENTLQYLRNKNTDPIMMAELNATFNLAKSTAVSLTGGKKRKFDHVEMDRVKGTPRGPSNIPSKPREGRRHSSERSGVREGYERAMCPDPAPVSTSRTDSRYYTGAAGGGGPFRGRGHSGVPFGYTRAVDSYQPY